MTMEAEKGNNILSNAAWLAATAVFVKLIGLLYKIPMAHALSDEGMGYFNAAYTIYSLLYLLGSAGVPKAITILISGCSARNERERQKIFCIASRLFLKIGLVLFVLLFALAHPIARWIGSPNAAPSILLISPCLLMVSLGGVYRGYLVAKGDFSTTAIASLIEAGAKLILGLLFIILGKAISLPLEWVCALSVLGIVIGTFVSSIYLKINIKIKNQDQILKQFDFYRGEKKNIQMQILRIAMPITFGSIAAGISSLVDLSMIIKRLEFSGVGVEEATAIYGNYTTLAVPMLQVASALLAPISVVLLPHLSSARADRKRDGFDFMLGIGCEMSAFVSVPLAFIFFFFPKNLLSILFPASSASLAAPLLRVLSIGVLSLSMLFILNTILEASGRASLQMGSMLIGVLVKMPISYFLISNPNYGILGAPIGTVVGYVVSMLFSWICCGAFGISSTLLKTYLRPFLNSAISVLCVGALLYIFGQNFNSWGRNFLTLFLFGSFYLLLSYLFGVLRIEKIKKIAKQPKSIA